MTFAEILNDAMYSDTKIKVKTKMRGEISGVPIGVDEFDTDPDRLGYYIDISKHEMDTVYLDEIVEITKLPKRIPKNAALHESIKL
ncbi:MAG: hypothetical protein FWD71_16030 [Oscillospiraceae bacterium]|nr:hypothetical protein [Oscillospiraceae bacterium]